MNLYVRYFDHETLATTIDEVVAFVATLHEVKSNPEMFNRVADFLHSDSTFPFRLKVSYSNYILFLKTEANTLDEFKHLERLHKEQRAEGRMTAAEKKRQQMDALNRPRRGWYEGRILFKRVILDLETSKCSYVDTVFRAKLKADSPMDCYNRLIDHLQHREDVDPRSQFPSPKNNNFEYKFLEETAAQ